MPEKAFSVCIKDSVFIDPCMGSGHILVYAFDVLMQIYTASGWSERDAAKSILENNLYGLDIDDRAGQLAYFAIMMKARRYNRRILNGENKPNVMAIQDSAFMTAELIDYVAAGNAQIRKDLAAIKTVFTDAKEYGSILDVKPVDFTALYNRIVVIEDSATEDLFAMMHREIAITKLTGLIKQAEIMAQKYHVVVTNPPYMGGGGMSAKLSDYLKDHYIESKADLFSAFIEKCIVLCLKNGYSALITMQSWMFLQSFKGLRSKMITDGSIVNMLHLGMNAFATGDVGTIVQTCAFVFSKRARNISGTYVRCTEENSGEKKNTAVLETCKSIGCRSADNVFVLSMSTFEAIDGSPIAYWSSSEIRNAFLGKRLSDYGDIKTGLQTGDNNRFLRMWYEVSYTNISFESCSLETFVSSGKKWLPQVKGGEFRRWYGNYDYVLDWSNNGMQIRNHKGCRMNAMLNPDACFREGMSWSHTSDRFGVRYQPASIVFNVEAPSFFAFNNENRLYCLGFLNSHVARYCMDLMNSTIHFLAGNVKTIPLILTPTKKESVSKKVKSNIDYSRLDWDAFETSWDFTRHPMLPVYADAPDYAYRISNFYDMWAHQCQERFNQLKANEEELNRIFIDIYGLQEELTPEVEDKDVTVRLADKTRDIKSFISYAVGCMLGRYSLDAEGLAYAGGVWDENKYHSFIPDADNIIPICDDEYFEDDIVGRFIEFVETVYGTDTLEENLTFIADALSGSGTPREVIRKYFLSDFFADHLKTYQKRPIYWQFDSGKKNGFKCLVYMHRYQPDTIARIRTDYIHELQSRYRTAIADLEDRVEHASASERVKLSKQLAKIKDQELELRKYEEKIHHLADQMIEIDLDDGVKVNYAKFGDVLAKIK